MGRFLLFVFYLFVLSVLPAAAHEAEYTITEAELLRLETISENWEKNKRSQQLQVQSLKQRLTEALSKSESLSGQLQTERETLTSLRQFYDAYEKEVQDTLTLNKAEIKNLKELNTELEKEKAKLEKAFLVLLFILILFVLVASVKLFIKYKTRFLK